MLSLAGQWIWDFWFADDGERFHLFHLVAPVSLGDDGRRHRAARIGHAVSDDLSNWTPVAAPFGVGEKGSFDETATWTGNVVRGDDGRWRMFYTGSRFLEPEPVYTNIETVGVAVSDDLMTWEKLPGPVARADSRWYETLGTGDWPEEAWRDPWVFADPNGDGWHMLVTARANHGPTDDRGVIGHARSADLDHWEVQPPLSEPGAGFAHLEVPQVAEIDGSWFLLFSCPVEALSTAHRSRFEYTGTWSLPVDCPTGPFSVDQALPLTDFTRYSGRIARRRDGSSVLVTFRNGLPGQPFPGIIDDPLDISISHGRLVIDSNPYRSRTVDEGHSQAV